MTNYNIEANLLLDFESFSESGIELTSEQVDRAVELSDRLLNPERQWQTYLNSLALFGFETWLESRDNTLALDTTNCSIYHPSYANYIDGVFNLTVGEYKICLVTNGVAIDETIAIDRAVIDLPEYAAHFYILLDVIEEQQEVKLNSFITHDDLSRRNNLVADADWTYELPLVWFNPELDDLLLQLRCLSPNSFTLPQATASDIQSLLESSLTQLQSGQPLHQIMTWSQGRMILRNPDLLSWLYELQTSQPSQTDALANLRDRLTNAVAEVAQRAINVKAWLSDELDELAPNLAWTLLPTPAFAPSGLRDLEVVNRESPATEFEAVVTQLRQTGEDIPEAAAGAYRDLAIANQELRLFVVTWTIEETPDTPEWSLMLVLGARPNSYLPRGLKLKIAEEDTLLDEKAVAEDTADSYIYTQVIGELDEEFSASIVLNSDILTLPKFAFS